jgi:hypothetical protein
MLVLLLIVCYLIAGCFSASPAGNPLFLSQYLPNQPQVARKLSQVQGNFTYSNN